MNRSRIVSYLRRAATTRGDMVPCQPDPAAYWREEDRRHWEKQARYAQNTGAEAAAGLPDQQKGLQEEPLQLDASIPPPSPSDTTPGDLVEAPQLQPPPDPPSMAQILDDISALVRQYLFCTEDQLTVLTLWIVHTYGFEYFSVAPYLNIFSPESQSGKTVCMQLLHLLCHNAWMPSGITPARLIKRVVNSQPTLLLDNWNTLLRPAGDQSMVGFLTAGWAHGNRFVARNQKEADESIFCPKAFAGPIGLPASLADRCIPIALQRRKPTRQILPFWPDIVFKAALRVVEPIPGWFRKNAGVLREKAFIFLCHPWLEISRHQDDAAAPLLAIAQLAGGKWLRKAQYSLFRIFKAHSAGPHSIGIQLLSDIRNFFREHQDPPRIHTGPLLEYLNALEDRPWTDKKTKKKLTSNGLRLMLQNFPIHRSSNQRIGTLNFKGFSFRHFVLSWETYLPELASLQSAPVVTNEAPVVTKWAEVVTKSPQVVTNEPQVVTKTAAGKDNPNAFNTCADPPPK